MVEVEKAPVLDTTKDKKEEATEGQDDMEIDDSHHVSEADPIQDARVTPSFCFRLS